MHGNVTDVHADIPFDISFDILSDISFDILSGINSAILSVIHSATLADLESGITIAILFDTVSDTYLMAYGQFRRPLCLLPER